MSKKRRKSSPDPLDTMIDLAGAAVMGAVAKHKLKSDYAKGQGRESAKAAQMVFGMGSLRRGSAGLMSLGGLLGVNSAIKDIEKSEQARKVVTPIFDDGIDLTSYKVNDNRYAWRLNCEDGSEYGIYPEDYETRDEYSKAIRAAKEGCGKTDEAGCFEKPDAGPLVNEPASQEQSHAVLFCRVSLLSSGKTEYFRTDDMTLKRGDIVEVPCEDGITTGVIVSIEHCTPGDYPQPLDETKEIIGLASE